MIEEDAGIPIRDTKLQTYQYNTYFVKFKPTSHSPTGSVTKIMHSGYCSKKKSI